VTGLVGGAAWVFPGVGPAGALVRVSRGDGDALVGVSLDEGREWLGELVDDVGAATSLTDTGLPGSTLAGGAGSCLDTRPFWSPDTTPRTRPAASILLWAVSSLSPITEGTGTRTIVVLGVITSRSAKPAQMRMLAAATTKPQPG
jgi:hypothetical protein